jgi:hypothetical protein
MEMSDSDKLRLLADWLDLKFPNDSDPQVQIDLRRIASELNQLKNEVDYYRAWKRY